MMGKVIQLRDPRPELLPSISGLWLFDFIVQDLLKTSGKVHLFRLDQLTAVEVRAAGVKDKEEGNWEVVGNKGRNGPVSLEEDTPAREEDDQ